MRHSFTIQMLGMHSLAYADDNVQCMVMIKQDKHFHGFKSVITTALDIGTSLAVIWMANKA